MRSTLIVPVFVLVAGCASSSASRRFALGAPDVRTPALRSSPAAARVMTLLDAHREQLTACFDALLARRETLAPSMSVRLDLELREHEIDLRAVRPADPNTVIDRTLAGCLDEVMIPWQSDGTQGELEVPLRVTAHPSPASTSVAVETGPRWQPAERHGE
jgi:hypothetical protein